MLVLSVHRLYNNIIYCLHDRPVLVHPAVLGLAVAGLADGALKNKQKSLQST